MRQSALSITHKPEDSPLVGDFPCSRHPERSPRSATANSVGFVSVWFCASSVVEHVRHFAQKSRERKAFVLLLSYTEAAAGHLWVGLGALDLPVSGCSYSGTMMGITTPSSHTRGYEITRLASHLCRFQVAVLPPVEKSDVRPVWADCVGITAGKRRKLVATR